jgi:proline iminopeptidase
MAFAQQQGAATGLVQTPDVDLAYEVYGVESAATPVIAVNGGPGLSHIYMLQNNVWARLAKRRQVIFYDQRGTGESTRMTVGAAQDMDAQVADLEAVRAALKFDKVALVGDSYGGMLAMAYAAAHPEHVERLVLSDSAPPAWKDIVHLLPDVFPDVEEKDAALDVKPPDQGVAGDPDKQGDPAASAAAKTPDPDEIAQEHLRNHFRMIFWSDTKRDAYLAGAKDLGYNPAVGDAVSKATEKVDLTAALPKFEFPVLVITGRYDMNVAPLTAWRMYKAIPGARFVVFERSGHLPSYEEPDKYVQVLDGFLAGK